MKQRTSTHGWGLLRLGIVLLFCLWAAVILAPGARAAENSSWVGANVKDGVVLGYYGAGGDVVVPNSVTAIGPEAFKGNDNVTSITIPGTVQEIGYRAFEGCEALEEVIFSDPVDGAELTIRVSAFSDCAALRTIEIPATAKYVTGNVFKGCASLEEIRVHPDNPYYFAQDGVLFGPWVDEGEVQYDDPNLTLLAYPCGRAPGSYTIPTQVNGRTVDRLWASSFRTAKNLTGIEIPATCTILGANAFEGTGLTQVTIPGTVLTMNPGLFEGCTDLTDVTFENRVGELGMSFFDGCTSLQRLSFQKGGPSSLGMYAFRNCKSLSALLLPDGLLSIEAASFEGCSNLQRVFIPASVISFPGDEYGDYNPFGGAAPGLHVYVVKGSAGEKWAVKNAEDFGWSYSTLTGRDELAGLDAGVYSLVDMGRKVMLEGAFPLGTTLRVERVTSGAEYEQFRGQAAGGGLAVYRLELVPGSAPVPDSMKLSLGLPAGMSRNARLFALSDGQVTQLSASMVAGTLSAQVEELGYYGLMDATAAPDPGQEEPTAVTLNRGQAEVAVGKSVQLTVTVTPAAAKDKTVTWSSSDPQVAAVDRKGLVTGVAAGTATITVKTVNGLTAECQVTVTGGAVVPPQPTGSVTAEGASILAGGDRDSDGNGVFQLALTGPSRVANLQIWFETDGTAPRLEGKNGFALLGEARELGSSGGRTAYTAVLVYLNGEGASLTQAGTVPVAELKVAGETPTVTVSDWKISGLTRDGDPDSIRYGTLIQGIDPNSATFTGEKSRDVNGDGTVDLLDITQAQAYYRAERQDANWAQAEKLDFNSDGRIDIEDLMAIWLSFGQKP